MKALKAILVVGAATMVWTACSNANARYVDLKTGKPVDIVYAESCGMLLDTKTGKPVEIVVDTKSQDTIWGTTAEVINGKVRLKDDGYYVYVDDHGREVEYKYKSDGDGDIKIKKGDDAYKYKRDDDGSYKVKVGEDYKKKVDDDGDVTIKDGDKKIKIDGETGKKKIKIDD